MKPKHLTYASTIATLYVVLTLLSHILALDSGAFCLRLSEVLCILPCFTKAAVPGLFIGCFLSNILIGASIWDILFGSLATLLGAVFTEKLKKYPYIAVLAPILSNTLILPPVMVYAYSLPGTIWYFALTTFICEVISCGALGLILYSALKKHSIFN